LRWLVTSTKNAKNLTTSAHYTKEPFPQAVHLSLPENHAQCVSFSKIVLELVL